MLKGRVRRTPLSCSLGVGGFGIGIIIIIIFIREVGEPPRRFLVVGGVGRGSLAIVLDVRGIVILAAGSICAGYLAVFHHIRLDEVLGKSGRCQRNRVRGKSNRERRAIGAYLSRF